MGMVDITFRQIAPTDELVDAIRGMCQVIGDAVADTVRWHVVVEHHQTAGTMSRVQMMLDAPPECVEVSAAHADAVVCVQQAFAKLLGRPELSRATQAA